MRVFTGALFIFIALLPYAAMLGRRGGDAVPSRAERTLSIISPHRREVRLEYSRGFREWMRRTHRRDVDIQWLDVGGTSKILKDIESRFASSPGVLGVDILFGGGVAPYYTGIQNGWLDKVAVPAPILDAIPKQVAGAPVYDPEGRWFGVALSGFGILYNRPLIERLCLPVPRQWEDLGRPEFRSWIASGDPRSSGSVHMCYEIILQAYGFEKGWGLIARICANVRNFGEAGGTAPREVASGEVAAGMVIDQYAQTVIDAVGNDLLVFVLPDETTMVGPDAIGVFRGAKERELAALFVQYALSEEGQRILYQPAGENGQKYSLHRLPVVASLYEKPGGPRVNPYRYRGSFQYDEGLGNRRWNVVNDLIGVCLIDAHADLAKAWESLIASGCPSDRVARLCAPPVPAGEMEALIPRWKEPRERLETTRRWAHECQARYRQLAEEGRAAERVGETASRGK